MMNREFEDFLRYVMANDSKPEQRKAITGFGLPTNYRIVDTATGNTVTAVEHRDVAETIAAQNTELIGHRFEARAMWR
jgi:hypothetical protein